MAIEMNQDPESAEWVRTPAAALTYYLSLTFEEQTALAFVIDWHRRTVQKQMKELIRQMELQY